MPELKVGYSGQSYYPWYDWAFKYAQSYNFLLGKRDGYFGENEASFVREMQRRKGIVIDGIFGDRTAAAVGYKWPGSATPPVVVTRRKIWIYTFPGSGADYWFGPSHDLGEKCKKILNINHQPVKFIKGGYLGFLGGDSKFSYVEVTWNQCKSLEWLLDNNPDAQEALGLALRYCESHGWNNPEEISDAQLVEVAQALEFEFHLSGYSQSADGGEDAAEWLFGDSGYVHPGDKTKTPSTGKYRLLRHCLKRVVQFGNPSTEGTGIARKSRPGWLRSKIRNINKPDDFYAKVPATDKIRPIFYGVIIHAEMELPFFVHVLRIAVPVITEWGAKLLPIFGPLLGGFGPMVQMGLGTLQGLQGINNIPLFGNLMGQAGSSLDQKTTNEMIELLKPTGVFDNIPGLIGLVGAVPGLQSHGMYGPADVDAAYHHIASFRR